MLLKMFKMPLGLRNLAVPATRSHDRDEVVSTFEEHSDWTIILVNL